MSEVACVVLAGASADEALKARYNVNWRAEVPLAGKRMIDWVLSAIRESGSVGHVILVADFGADADITLKPGASFLDNVMAGVEAAGEAETLMVTASDIPLATGEAFSFLVGEGLKKNADFVYPVINRIDCDAKYPRLRRTYHRVREGTFTGGNAVLVRRQYVLSSRERIEQLYQARKHPLKLASMIGFGTLIRAAAAKKLWAGALSIPAIERAAERTMGGRLRALVCPWPELGEDLDKLEDFVEGERLLGQLKPGD